MMSFGQPDQNAEPINEQRHQPPGGSTAGSGNSSRQQHADRVLDHLAPLVEFSHARSVGTGAALTSSKCLLGATTRLGRDWGWLKEAAQATPAQPAGLRPTVAGRETRTHPDQRRARTFECRWPGQSCRRGWYWYHQRRKTPLHTTRGQGLNTGTRALGAGNGVLARFRFVDQRIASTETAGRRGATPGRFVFSSTDKIGTIHAAKVHDPRPRSQIAVPAILPIDREASRMPAIPLART